MQVETSEDISATPVNTSPIQLESPMKTYKKSYFILIPVGTIALAAMGSAVGALFGAVIGWTAAYLFMQFISGTKLLKLNFKEFPLGHSLTDEQLYAHLSSLSLHPDFKLEKRASGVRFIFKNTTMHTIHIDKKKRVYSIISKLSKKQLIKKRHNPGVVEYSHAYTAMPYIKHAMEKAIAIESGTEVV